MSKAKTISTTNSSVVSTLDETRREQARLRKQKQRERDRQHQQLMVIEQATKLPDVVTKLPDAVTCHAVTPAPTPSKIKPSVTTEAVTAGWWNAAGRGIVGVTLVAIGVMIALTSMQANSWYGYSLAADAAAGDIFSRLSVLAEVVACVLPTANRFYWQDGDRWTALKGSALMMVALMVVFFAASGFVVTNLSNSVEVRVERETPAVKEAKRKADALTKSKEDECKKRGDKCRQLERDEQTAFDDLKTERDKVAASADPQAEALHVTSNTLRTAKAGVMVLMCLAAGYIISLGWGLVFCRRQQWTAASARR